MPDAGACDIAGPPGIEESRGRHKGGGLPRCRRIGIGVRRSRGHSGCNQPAGTGACAAQIVVENAARKGLGPADKCFSLGTEEAIILRKENANYNQIKKRLIL
jgi:hypothetical protein